MLTIKVFSLFLVGILILLVSCTIDNDNDYLASTGEVVKEGGSANKTNLTQKTPIEQNFKTETKNTSASKEISKPTDAEYIDLKRLEEEINDVMGSLYDFKADPSHSDYIRSNELKYYTIHIIRDKSDFIKDAEDFCDEYCARNWNGWKYYINMSNFQALYPLLKRENFSTDELYNEYLRDALFVSLKIQEKSYSIDNGKVLEYQFLPWMTDNSGTYFEGAYEGTSLLYKIYCAPNITILLRPKWDVYKVEFPVATLTDTYSTWNNYILPIRKEFLEKVNELLMRCKVDRDFFGDYQFPEFSSSEILTGYWKVYYNFYFNLTSQIDISVEKRTNGKYLFKQLNFSFTNLDDVELYDLNLRVEITPDLKSSITLYDKSATGFLGPGKILEKSFAKDDIEFYDNITVEAALYTAEGKVNIRPIKKIFTKEDFIR